MLFLVTQELPLEIRVSEEIQQKNVERHLDG